MEDEKTKAWGCLITFTIIVIAFIIIGIKGCNDRAKREKLLENKTEVYVLNANGSVTLKLVDNSTFIGHDTIYIGSSNIYLNNTNEDLVEYMVKYTKSGVNNDDPIGTIIHPNEYFYWHQDDDYYMFQAPPSSTTIVTHGRGHSIDFKYLHFLDYLRNKPDDVRTPY